MKYGADKLIRLAGSLTTTKSVREWLFDGFEDSLLTIIKKVKPPGVVLPPFNKFGWFVDRNLSATYDGIVNKIEEIFQNSFKEKRFSYHFRPFRNVQRSEEHDTHGNANFMEFRFVY